MLRFTQARFLAPITTLQEGCSVLVSAGWTTLSRSGSRRWRGHSLVLDWDTRRVRSITARQVVIHFSLG